MLRLSSKLAILPIIALVATSGFASGRSIAAKNRGLDAPATQKRKIIVEPSVRANYRLSFDATEDSSLQTTLYIDSASIQ